MRNPVRVGRLANGMTFYAQPGYRVNLSAIGAKVGSIHAPRSKVALPHITEHLMARHSSHMTVDDINLMLLEFAGDPDSRNIRIDLTNTLYGHDMLAYSHHMKQLFSAFAQLLEERVLDAESIAVEKSVINNEIFLRGKDVAESETTDALRALLFKNHPAGLRIDGEIPDLKSITPEDVKRFVHKHYRASNMFVIMLGPSYREVSRLVHQKFGHWPKMPALSNGFARYAAYRPPKGNLYSEQVRGGIHQTHMAFGFRTEGYLSDDSIALKLLSLILHHILVTRLREQNLKFNQGAYRVYTFSENSFIHGLFSVQLASRSAKYIEYSRAVILEEIERLAYSLPPAEIFHVAQRSLRNQHRCNWGEIPLWTCEAVAMAASNGDPDLVDLHKHPEQLMAVTRHDIRRVVRKYLQHPHGCAIIRPR
jgi:zinc protease